jgi:hypothetical protein
MLGGGSEREWLEPLDSEGNRNPDLPITERVVGCHVGPYAGLNLYNPQPGFEYEWLCNPEGHLGGPAAALQIHEIGGQVVTDSDPEIAAIKTMEGMESNPLDTSTVFKELILVRIPAERQHQRMQEIADKNKRMLRRGPEESFVGRASSLESERYSGRGPTRFAMRGHQTDFNRGHDTVEVSLPDSGIVRTENID